MGGIAHIFLGGGGGATRPLPPDDNKPIVLGFEGMGAPSRDPGDAALLHEPHKPGRVPQESSQTSLFLLKP